VALAFAMLEAGVELTAAEDTAAKIKVARAIARVLFMAVSLVFMTRCSS
jgi:hypothetical protein